VRAEPTQSHCGPDLWGGVGDPAGRVSDPALQPRPFGTKPDHELRSLQKLARAS
jgi:hypothetical protein